MLHRRHYRSAKRRGATVVEFAFAAPILLGIVFASLEFSRMNNLWGTSVNAAYEGARRGIVPGASADDAKARAQSVLDVVNANDAQITVTPSVILPDTPEVLVQIQIPMNSNSWLAAVFFKDKMVTAECKLDRDLIETSVVE